MNLLWQFKLKQIYGCYWNGGYFFKPTFTFPYKSVCLLFREVINNKKEIFHSQIISFFFKSTCQILRSSNSKKSLKNLLPASNKMNKIIATLQGDWVRSEPMEFGMNNWSQKNFSKIKVNWLVKIYLKHLILKKIFGYLF